MLADAELRSSLSAEQFTFMPAVRPRPRDQIWTVDEVERLVEERVGEVRFGRARLTSDTRFEPDLFVVPSVDGKRRRADDSAIVDVSLVVEVLSPSSLRHDRFTKRRFFQRHGVPVYWIVDPDGESIEIWRPGDDRPELTDEHLTWQPAGASQTFELDVQQFFADVADDADDQ